MKMSVFMGICRLWAFRVSYIGDDCTISFYQNRERNGGLVGQMERILETRQERVTKSRKVKAHQRNSKLMGATLAMSLTAVSLLSQPKDAKACDCVDYYTIKEGDTLYSLAKQYKVTAEQLRQKNGLTTDSLKVGQQIIVPFKDVNGNFPHVELEEENKTEAATTDKTTKKVYTVKSGDSLWNVSKTFGVSVEKLMKDNQLKNATLFPGQKLNILQPTAVSQSDNLTYTVTTGDSLWKIAQKYKTTIEKIISDNKLASDLVIPGQKLTIKIEKKKPGTEPGNTNDQRNNNFSTTYIVKNGDTLWNLAKKYNISLEKLKKDNKLDSDYLLVGQKLIVPTNHISSLPSPVVTYKVQPGDTIYSLAKRFNMNVKQIMELNQLKDAYVLIGQDLFISAKDVEQFSGKIIGANDSSSIEVLINGQYIDLEVTYGTAQKYQQWNNKNAFITYKKGSKTKRPALIHIDLN